MSAVNAVSENQTVVSVVRTPAGGHAPNRPRITQAELELYEALRQVAYELPRARKELLAKLDQGAEIERGPWTVEARSWQLRSFSLAKLARLLGEPRALELQSQIEPTVCRGLVVRAAESVGHASGSRHGDGGQPNVASRFVDTCERPGASGVP